uniref:Uncharacterized protein n=1 Tax=Stomoxys calcitrans TaxID=35570 RepID=A0A1I8P9C7_STOCA
MHGQFLNGFWLLFTPNAAILLIYVAIQPEMSLIAEQNLSKFEHISNRTLILKFLISLVLFAAVSSLCVLAADEEKDNNKEKEYRGQYNPNAYNDNRYYKNRDYYNQRYYHDNLLKQYKSDITGKDSRIIEQKLEPAIDGNFAYEFDSENGIHVDAHGASIKIGNDDEGQKIEGSFAFITPEGLRVGVRYVADENGYRPVYTYDGVEAVKYSNAAHGTDISVARSN